MKQRLFTIFLILALLVFMTACSAAGAAQTLDHAEEKIENKLDAAEDAAENALRRAAAPAPTVSAAPAESGSSGTTVTQAQAENIALEYAGFSAGQVERLRTDYEVDDGVPQYDVEFHQGDWEYEFEISAEDGRILSFDKDHKYD